MLIFERSVLVISVYMSMRFVIFTGVASTLVRTGNSCLEAVAVAFTAVRLFAPAENCLDLAFLSFLERPDKDITFLVAFLVLARLASAIRTTGQSIFQALAVKFETEG